MSKVDFSYKRIADPVHGTIGLSELEIGIINTSVFQRLRNVRQLGLVNHVFPAADYSRFAHSVGVCHIAGLILNNLRLQGARLTDGVIQEYRLAALLHDVGHYPFSHAMETVVGDYYRRAAIVGDSSNTENGGGESGDQETIRTFYDHERVGREILGE